MREGGLGLLSSGLPSAVAGRRQYTLCGGMRGRWTKKTAERRYDKDKGGRKKTVKKEVAFWTKGVGAGRGMWYTAAVTGRVAPSHQSPFGPADPTGGCFLCPCPAVPPARGGPGAKSDREGIEIVRNKILTEKSFYRALLTVAIPIALQNLISFGVNMMDTVMLGQLGEVQLSAASLANQPFFVFSMFSFGFAAGGSVMISQYWGKGDTAAISRIMAIGLKFVVVLSLLVTALVLCFPEAILRLFTADPEVVAEGVRYLKIIAFSYFFYGVSNCYITSLRGVEQVKISVVIYSVSFVINVIINYIFIFGAFGAPALGVAGAAVGTLCARISELVMSIVYMERFEKRTGFRLRHLFHKMDRLLLGDYVKTSLPVAFNEIAWGLSTSVHAAILGRMGASVVAANSIVNVVTQLAFIFLFGLSNATAIQIGKAVSSKPAGYVRKMATTMQLLSRGVGAVGASIVLAIRKPVIGLYNIAPETTAMAGEMMIAAAVMTFLISVEVISTMGILRGGGDTKFTFFIDVFFIWAVATPLGAYFGLVAKVAAPVVYVLLRIDSPIKTVVSFFRIRSGCWMRNVTRDESELAAE